MTVIPTFHCGGRCAEVIELYRRAFDLQVDFQQRDDATGLIRHTEARIGAQRVRLSDGGAERGAAYADALFLAVTFDTTAEVERVFDILAEGGTAIQRPHAAPFAACMSEVRDCFGFRWFLMVD